MGSMRFDRKDFVEGSIFNRFSFDSEPRGTIERALGVFDCELRPRPDLATPRFEFWDAYAKSTPDSQLPKSLRGVVRAERRESLHARLG